MHLHEYVAPAARRPFKPGQHDCALFVAGWVREVTTIDLAEGWRGAYRSEGGGLRKLRRAGFESPVAVLEGALPEIAPVAALPGDVVVLEDEAMGILGGEQVYVLRAEGLGIVPRSQVRRAFACRR